MRVMKWRVFVTFQFLVMSIVGCELVGTVGQSGKSVVTTRRSARLGDNGRIDVLLGINTEDTNREERILLAIISFCPDKQAIEIRERAVDGPESSILGLTYKFDAVRSFGFTVGWNRQSETVVIEGSQLSRNKGNVFVVSPDGLSKNYFPQLTFDRQIKKREHAIGRLCEDLLSEEEILQLPRLEDLIRQLTKN
ncbi:MAG: hypothetical protein ACK56W_09095 [Pirellula sp.]|jgi:hypothetical protein